MFSLDQIRINPKSYGLGHDVCVKKICADALILSFWQLYQLFFPKLFNQRYHLYPKTRFCFGRLVYILLEVIIVLLLFYDMG